ncbi:MAG: hypothetical protein C5B46_06255 [Proteobacteria bacterium]|nr:MAG: hypothetical protein C5B46_06255 [Pseudomonadota bacterium]
MPERLYGRTLFHRAIGSTLERFHAPVRALHAVEDATIAFGHTDIERGAGAVSRLVGWLFGFPPGGRRMPTAITVVADRGAEIWHRRFAGHPILTQLEAHPGTNKSVIVERFRFGVAFELEVTEHGGSLGFRLLGMRLCGAPMPRWLWPRLRGEEHAERGGFCFDIDISLPLWGHLIRYRGWVKPV